MIRRRAVQKEHPNLDIIQSLWNTTVGVGAWGEQSMWNMKRGKEDRYNIIMIKIMTPIILF